MKAAFSKWLNHFGKPIGARQCTGGSGLTDRSTKSFSEESSHQRSYWKSEQGNGRGKGVQGNRGAPGAVASGSKRSVLQSQRVGEVRSPLLGLCQACSDHVTPRNMFFNFFFGHISTSAPVGGSSTRIDSARKTSKTNEDIVEKY